MNEADTGRSYLLPKLKSLGWEDETDAQSPIWMVTSNGDLRQVRLGPLQGWYCRRSCALQGWGRLLI